MKIEDGGAQSRNIISVSALNDYIKGRLESDRFLYDIYLRGEISNFTNHYKTGHFYFSIKDETSVIKAVMFKGYASKLRFIPENGMKIIAHGRIGAY
ncbi:MAG: exodeoxyribonuclease VII large subunit, partial [Clostridia bacterium]|nr:exodeoxyribonuclease VII large subunit [Clostridia bacterium]